ncbi:nitroreductase [Haliscomenobacter sp.]|uniref:Acg family FMN-binding oxidoreductase n=1 Tax=Haliscomenobacter sp. TaxID=2717303 RepID=UPI003364CBF5
MNRKKFLGVAGGAVLVVAGGYYLQSDKSNFVRADLEGSFPEKIPLTADERNILFLASLAPSGHNTQPWFVQYIEPYHWIIGNDKSKWLPGVDPTQRETMLSIGAFTQNLEYAASNLGYQSQFTILANNNQDEQVLSVKLTKASNTPKYNIEKIKQRRTIRSNYLSEVLKKEDFDELMAGERDVFHWLPNTSKEHQYLNEQTIEANRIQSYRDAAQSELADWIRFSSKDAAKHGDGLTTASMEIKGVPAWVLRNFYGKSNVMKKNFREQSIDTVHKQVSQSAGWLLITSKDNAVATLIDTGRRLQKLWLNIREKGIAIHPMTQILEETTTNAELNSAIGIKDPIQFILRTGYVKTYPQPVSLRRSVDGFVRM